MLRSITSNESRSSSIAGYDVCAAALAQASPALSSGSRMRKNSLPSVAVSDLTSKVALKCPRLEPDLDGCPGRILVENETAAAGHLQSCPECAHDRRATPAVAVRYVCWQLRHNRRQPRPALPQHRQQRSDASGGGGHGPGRRRCPPKRLRRLRRHSGHRQARPQQRRHIAGSCRLRRIRSRLFGPPGQKTWHPSWSRCCNQSAAFAIAARVSSCRRSRLSG